MFKQKILVCVCVFVLSLLFFLFLFIILTYIYIKKKENAKKQIINPAEYIYFYIYRLFVYTNKRKQAFFR